MSIFFNKIVTSNKQIKSAFSKPYIKSDFFFVSVQGPAGGQGIPGDAGDPGPMVGTFFL